MHSLNANIVFSNTLYICLWDYQISMVALYSHVLCVYQSFVTVMVYKIK